MSCLTSSQKTDIQAQITELNEQIALATAAYKAALPNSEIVRYRLDTGDASQSAERRKPKEIREEIDALKSERARLVARLNGTGIVDLRLRRRPGGFLRGRYV